MAQAMADGPSNGLLKPKEEEEERQIITPRNGYCFQPHPLVTETWDALRRSMIHFHGQPVGTIAALDNPSEKLNYDQVFNEHMQNHLSISWGIQDNPSLPPFVFKSDLKSWMTNVSTNPLDHWLATNSSMKKTCTDNGGKSNPLKQCKKRNIDLFTIPSSVTRIVTVKTTFNDDNVEIFKFPISSGGLLNLKNIVAQRFKLKSNRLRLKYIDKENDLILITCDEDLKLAVETTAINNRINLICLPCAAGWLHNGGVGIIQPTLESVADNFAFLEHSLDAESLVATGSTDAGEKSRKKRKTESDLLPPVIGLVTANITYKQHKKVFQFFISSGLSYLENQVARSFKLEGKELRLKYWDEDDDLILVALDVDLKLAVLSTGGNNTINLICLSD